MQVTLVGVQNVRLSRNGRDMERPHSRRVMMNDKQLVDALVQDGLLAFEPARGLRSYYWLLLGADEFVRFDTEHEIVHDWRVAGACMERITEDTFTWFFF